MTILVKIQQTQTRAVPGRTPVSQRLRTEAPLSSARTWTTFPSTRSPSGSAEVPRARGAARRLPRATWTGPPPTRTRSTTWRKRRRRMPRQRRTCRTPRSQRAARRGPGPCGVMGTRRRTRSCAASGRGRAAAAPPPLARTSGMQSCRSLWRQKMTEAGTVIARSTPTAMVPTSATTAALQGANPDQTLSMRDLMGPLLRRRLPNRASRFGAVARRRDRPRSPRASRTAAMARGRSTSPSRRPAATPRRGTRRRRALPERSTGDCRGSQRDRRLSRPAFQQRAALKATAAAAAGMVRPRRNPRRRRCPR
mmetsp:Transcript_39970/g.94983  ORF Transcript_39970/g.94983 Transcript_39970/m.94983 type:complete len:309 (-) Transcript_39970:862-1788(-)